MKSSYALLFFCCLFLQSELNAQVRPNNRILYTIPGINLGLGIPTHNLVKEDQFDLGLSAEVLKTGLWLQRGKFGLIPELSLLYYGSLDVYFSDWLRDRSIYGEHRQSNRTPTLSLSVTYQLHAHKRFQAHVFGGIVYRTNRWSIDNSRFLDVSGAAGKINDIVVSDLYSFKAEMVDPFIHYRIGATLLVDNKLPLNFRFWTDLFPPYDFEYEVNEISSWPNQEYATKNRSYWFWTIGASAELYGVLTR